MGCCESAVELKTKADNGDRYAQSRMSYNYALSNPEMSIKYLKMGATQGLKDSQWKLGWLYETGKLCHHGFHDNPTYRGSIDYKESYKWYKLRRSESDAKRVKLLLDNQIRKQKIIDDKHTYMTSEQKRLVIEMKNGDIDALYIVGIAYIIKPMYRSPMTLYDPFIHGIDGINIDHKEGIKLFKQCSKQGHTDASDQLGYIYGYKGLKDLTKVEVSSNMKEAYNYFKLAENTREMSKIAAILSVENNNDEMEKMRQKIDMLSQDRTVVPVPPPSYNDANI
jgi:TPR repeat protein